MGTHALEINGPVSRTTAVQTLILVTPAVFGLVGHIRHPLDGVIDQVVGICFLVIPALDGTPFFDDLVDLVVGDVATGLGTTAGLCRRIIPLAEISTCSRVSYYITFSVEGPDGMRTYTMGRGRSRQPS
jgi:hypothetical protein